MHSWRRFQLLLAVLLVCALIPFQASVTHAQSNSRYFSETGRTVSGAFLTYWNNNGNLAQFGYPISETFLGQSNYDGKNYTMQYFERALFEWHPEYSGTPYVILLGPLGRIRYNNRYPGGAPGQVPWNVQGTLRFSQTGKTLGGLFLQYWRQHGDVLQQGYPISDPFAEKSALDGKVYTVQYFERGVFEYHPENTGKPSVVLLSPLGYYTLCEFYGCPGRPVATGNAKISPPDLSTRYNQASGADLLNQNSDAAKKLNSIISFNPGAKRVLDLSKNIVNCGQQTGLLQSTFYSSKADWTAAGLVVIVQANQLRNPLEFLTCVAKAQFLGGGGVTGGGPIAPEIKYWKTRDGANYIFYAVTKAEVGADFCSLLPECPYR